MRECYIYGRVVWWVPERGGSGASIKWDMSHKHFISIKKK